MMDGVTSDRTIFYGLYSRNGFLLSLLSVPGIHVINLRTYVRR